MIESSSIVELITKCRLGEPAALAELVRRYRPVVRRAVRSRLAAAMRGRFDSLDFTQDVWASFFRVSLERADLTDEPALIAYLAQMARLKVTEEFRHQTTLKVGLGREKPAGILVDAVDGGPSPSAEVIARDRWERLTDGLDEKERRMLAMMREGYTHTAIAGEFGLSVRTVQRLVTRITWRAEAGGGRT